VVGHGGVTGALGNTAVDMTLLPTGPRSPYYRGSSPNQGALLAEMWRSGRMPGIEIEGRGRRWRRL